VNPGFISPKNQTPPSIAVMCNYPLDIDRAFSNKGKRILRKNRKDVADDGVELMFIEPSLVECVPHI
jgi:hypothetical protein